MSTNIDNITVGVTVFGEVVLAILTECAGTGQCYIVLFGFHSVSFPAPWQDGGHRKSRGYNVPRLKHPQNGMTRHGGTSEIKLSLIKNC